MRKKEPILYLVVPCYNEAEMLPKTAEVLKEKLADLVERFALSPKSRVAFVDDGSKDDTWAIIEQLATAEPFVGVKMSRNFGKERTLLGGLLFAREHADMVISLDADLEDDVAVLDQFVEKYLVGYEVVNGVRSHRKKDTFLKRFFAGTFYGLMRLLGSNIMPNQADYRLLGKRALDELSEFSESNIYLRGLVSELGYKSTIVKYARGKRAAGKTKFSFFKLFELSVDGMTSFSVRPLRLIVLLGMVFILISIGALIYALVSKFTNVAGQHYEQSEEILKRSRAYNQQGRV